MSSLYSCSKREIQDVKPAVGAASSPSLLGEAGKSDTTGTALWQKFVGMVEAGKIKDPTSQYVSKSTRIASDGTGARPTRPKANATTRTLVSLFVSPIAAAKPGLPGNTTNNVPPFDPGPGGGGGGGYVPNYSNFSSTEIVQPYDTAPANSTGAQQNSLKKGQSSTSSTNAFYTTENPNGYLYDLKIVKGPNPNRAPFHDNPHYHNIPIDLNEGAGGEYIYVSFTRDPSYVEYQRFGQSGCGDNGDEQPKDANGNYVNRPVTSLDTEVRCCTGLYSNCHGIYTPMYTTIGYTIDSNYMKVPDLNDGAGGSYIYAWLARQENTPSSYHPPIEVGVVTGNNVNIQPPLGWTRTGSDLNNGAGGSYIFLCYKNR